MASQLNTRIFGVLFVIWLAIGAVAAGQRGYFGGTPQDCAGAATIGVTAMARPLNYIGSQPQGHVSVAAALELSWNGSKVFSNIGSKGTT
jgi:hypothetical protein